MADRWRSWKLAGKWVFAAVFVVAGIAHFASTGFFLKVMPPYIPFHREVVLISGAIEIILGVLLLVPRSSRFAAWGLVALLVAVFPANIQAYQHRDVFPSFPHSDLIHLLRLPFQGVLIAWAYSYTGGSKEQFAG
jgi:uncharacterized membrane protein